MLENKQLVTLYYYIILITVIFLLFGKKNLMIFLCFSLAGILICLYGKEAIKMMNLQEGFNLRSKSDSGNPFTEYNCNNVTHLDFREPSKTFISYNQKLVGKANPKTFLKPIVVPPSNDLEVWKANDFVIHSHINDSSRTDDEASGYNVQPINIKENYECGYSNFGDMQRTGGFQAPIPVVSDFRGKLVPMCCGGNTKENYTAPYPVMSNYDGGLRPMCKPNCRENFTTDGYDDYINSSCGVYNQDNLKYGLPVNVGFGKCREDEKMASYNANYFTSMIEPNVYSRTQVAEQASSNAGISFTQQFEPTSQFSNKTDTMFTQYDPRIIEPIPEEKKISTEASLDSIYDPRFSGYGSSDRSYLDPVTGSRKFMYDDVDAIKQPNYITRNKIDIMSFGDRYGPLNIDNVNGNPNTCDIHMMANQTFLDWTGQQRLELQERLMRKNNAISWQRKMMPIRTTTTGGSGFSRI